MKEIIVVEVTLVAENSECDMWNNIRDAINKGSEYHCIGVKHIKTLDLDRILAKD